VSGVDHSAESVAAARRTNAAGIAAGRVDVQLGAVSHLPFADRTFDLVTAVETHYYWPEPAADMGEILRVMKLGGRLVIIAETHKDQTFSAVLAVPMMLLRARYLTLEQHRELFETAGFTGVEIHAQARKGWICAVGRKPDARPA
jgi:SAM-dependent methyltransferase